MENIQSLKILLRKKIIPNSAKGRYFCIKYLQYTNVLAVALQRNRGKIYSNVIILSDYSHQIQGIHQFFLWFVRHIYPNRSLFDITDKVDFFNTKMQMIKPKTDYVPKRNIRKKKHKNLSLQHVAMDIYITQRGLTSGKRSVVKFMLNSCQAC